MTIKTFRIFHVCRSLFIVIFTIFLASGCATIDKMFSNATPSPSPADSIPSPSPESSASPSTSKSRNSQSTESRNSKNRSNDEQLDQLVKTRECLPPNQAEYVSGNYKLGWTMGGSRYEGLLRMEGRIGKMRIQYFNEATNETETVDQTMVLASCTKGLIILGFNPVLASTTQKHPKYAADNLIFRRETNGTVTIVNYDDRGVAASVEIEQVSN